MNTSKTLPINSSIENRIEEQLLLAQRKHGLTVAVPLMFIALIAFGLISLLIALTIFVNFSIIFIVLMCLFILSAMLLAASKVFVDWYYHLYIVTDRKVAEVYCKPFFAESINEVRLDQVRCTESISSQMDL